MVTLQIIVPKVESGRVRYQVESLTLPNPVDRETLLEWLEAKKKGEA
jgi:hypothetical protein